MPPDRRLIRRGELFSTDELDSGEAELETVPPGPQIPPEDRNEPWGLITELPDRHPVRDWIRGLLHGS
jgi:hypothetical protein